MAGTDPNKSGPKSRLMPLIAAFERLGKQPYATVPGFSYLLELERAVQAEVDRMVVELREEGYSFKLLSDWATFSWRDWPVPGGPPVAEDGRELTQPPFHCESAGPWRPWQKRYREAVKRLRGEGEEVLSLAALQERRRQIENLETQLRVGPMPEVERSANNQSERTICVADVRRGDCVIDGLARIVVKAEESTGQDDLPYVMLTYHDGLEYPYDRDHELEFGSEEHVMKRF